jgi:hypothetical protein
MYRAFAHSESYGTHYSKFPRQGTLDFEVTLGNMVRPCLKTNKQQQQQIKTPANYKDTTPPQSFQSPGEFWKSSEVFLCFISQIHHVGESTQPTILTLNHCSSENGCTSCRVGTVHSPPAVHMGVHAHAHTHTHTHTHPSTLLSQADGLRPR